MVRPGEFDVWLCPHQFRVVYLIPLFVFSLPASPVVHQFDRHKELSEYFFKEKTKDYLAAWQSRHV